MDKHGDNLKSAEQKLRKSQMIENTKKIQTAYHAAQEMTDIQADDLILNQVGYQDLFDNMPNGCAYYKVLFDEAGIPVDLKYMKVNSAYAGNMNRSCSELAGQYVSKIFPQLAGGNVEWLKPYMTVALSGEPATFTQYVDGQDKWYSIAAYSPQPGYVVEISEDITDRRRIEVKVDQYVAELSERNVALNTSKSRYRGLLDHMNNIFEYHRVIVDENKHPVDLEFAEVNPAFEMQTGLKIADVVGQRLPEVTHGIEKAYWIQLLGGVAVTGQPTIVERYLKNIDTWYRVTAYSPESGHVASILEDITEQKKAESQKSENQRQVALIERVASLGALAAGVAHEINQPLQALKIMADGMIYWYDKGKENTMEKVIENCRRISLQAGYITDIVEWMQDFVNRAWSDIPEAVDVNKIVKQAVNMVQERLRIHNIQLRDLPCSPSPTVWADISRLKEIIIIILVNAIESFDGVDQTGKEIIITTSLIEQNAVIEISNNGPIIPDDIIEKIFEPFFSSAKSGANLGMGLAIVKSVVDAHNGTIQVYNIHQQVCFRMEFPVYIQGC